MYSIKAAAQATGLSVETLRAWERRYRVVVPTRDASGRRMYDAEDVLRLRRLREATEHGHPIRRLAALSDAKLADILNGAADHRPSAAPDAFVTRILGAAERFSAEDCEQALTLAIAMLPPQQLLTDVLQPLLREVGERWHRQEFQVSQERLVSSTVRRHLGLMLESYGRIAHRQPIVFATLPGERHEIGLLMSAMVCASRGFRLHYLGPDLPPEEIARFANHVDASIVALSMVLHDGIDRVPEQLRALASDLAPDGRIWLGGSACQKLPREDLPANCIPVENLAELERRLDMLPG
jgi:DNA-binding transcriptional MerR regulator/methylmalonyl-CoA mutase cobalamin-binding subunit